MTVCNIFKVVKTIIYIYWTLSCLIYKEEVLHFYFEVKAEVSLVPCLRKQGQAIHLWMLPVLQFQRYVEV